MKTNQNTTKIIIKKKLRTFLNANTYYPQKVHMFTKKQSSNNTPKKLAQSPIGQHDNYPKHTKTLKINNKEK